MELFSAIPLFGSVTNAAAIIFGSLTGMLLRKRLPAKILELPMQGMGIFAATLGVSMAMTSRNMLIVIVSISIGSVAGSFLDIEGRLRRAADRLEERFAGGSNGLSAGFIAATVLYCTGSMAVLGAFEEGLGGYPSLLLAKSTMDGLASIALSASLGFGVLFSSLAVLLYQGTLTLAASYLQPLMTEAAVTEMTATGGLMLVAIGLNILSLTKIRSMDMIPALGAAILLARIFL